MFAVPDTAKRYVARVRPYLGDGTSVLTTLHITTLVLRFGSNLILTRLLAPEAYGIVGIITSISYVLTMTTDMGLRPYVTRHETAHAELIQTVWTIRLIRNVTLGAIMFVGAGIFSRIYGSPEIANVIRICSLLFVIDGMASLSPLVGERDRRVVRLSFIDFFRFLFTTTVTIVAAYFLRNFWAVIVSMFLGSILSIFISYFLIPAPPMRIRFDRENALDLWKFSRFIIPSSIISILLTQTDKFFMAKFFPLAELGQFMLATTIATAVGGLAFQYIKRVFYPRFAQASREKPEKLRSMYYADRRKMMLFIAFGLGGLIGGADLLIRVLFNDNYLGAGFYLSILCFRPLGKLVSIPAEHALIAKGFIRATLTANIFRLIWVVGGSYIAYQMAGPMAVVILISLTEAALMPFFWWNLHRYDLFNPVEEFYIYGIAGVGFLIGYGVNAAANALMAAGYLPAF